MKKVATIVEFSLAIVFVTEAIKIEPTDPRETATTILEELGEETTAEIMDASTKVSRDCKDRIPGALSELEKDKRVTKRLSKEKKGYVWSLVS